MVARKSKRRGRRPQAGGPNCLVDVTITDLGHRGDGIGYLDGDPVYIPYTLPGDRVRSRIRNGRGEVVDLLERSEQRVEPSCSYFEKCGGCSMQHMRSMDYLNWKRSLVESALRHRNVRDVMVEPALSVPPGTRRRMTFTAERRGKAFVFGFHKRARHDLLEIEDCPLLDESIRSAIASLRSLAQTLLPVDGRLSLLVTKIRSGFDIWANHEDARSFSFDYEQQEQIAAEARKSGCARLTVNDDVSLRFEETTLSMAGIDAELPPGGFLQATEYSESRLQDLVVRAVGDADRIVDLFCGLGTFSFRLAKSARVTAIDSSEASVQALGQTSRRQSNLQDVSAMCRDLIEEPVLAKELNGFDAVVFDPPRKGALAQAREIAKSDIPQVASVSCDPGTFSRDAQILIDGGYRLDWVVPVDQFLWSHHIEMVASFVRE